MPNDYRLESSSADIQVLSAETVLDVTRFGIVTKPSGVRVMVNVPQAKVTDLQAHTTLQAYALLVETAMRTPGVVAARPVQDTDAAGLLADFMAFTVQVPDEDGSTDQPIQTEVLIPTSYFGTAAGYARGVDDRLQAGINGLRNAVTG